MTVMPENMNSVAIGVVVDVDAPGARIKVEFPWMQPPQPSNWAPIATLMSGGKRGMYYMPENGDEVLIAFDHGKFDHPYVVGFLWNGVDQPPADDQHLRVIRSVNGHEIAIFDPPVAAGDKGYVRVKDAHGNSVELANGQITIAGIGMIQINAPSVTINGRLVLPVGPPI
jgi:uncharacterized protein involved in type VI secretion and phage assembly